MIEDRYIHEFSFYAVRWKGDFVIRCKIEPSFHALYDQGDIIIFQDNDHWIKYAYENSDIGQPVMVSVVTNGVSDDCNGMPMSGAVWMQITRQGNNFALHYSQDGIQWKLSRIFRLMLDDEVLVGISAQCPFGESCKVIFSNLELLPNTYTNIRKPQ